MEKNEKLLATLRGLVKNIEDGKITVLSGVIQQDDDGTETYTVMGFRGEGVVDSVTHARIPYEFDSGFVKLKEDTKENNMNQLEMKIKSEELECEILNLKLEQKKINIKRLIKSDTSIETQLKNMEKSKTPIIIKSGDTWVAEYKGVDYLYVSDRASYCIKNFTAKDLLREIENGEWKPISEIKITDEIAKLRPMMIGLHSGHKRVMYGFTDDIVIFLGARDHKKGFRLATVKDLTVK